MKETEEMKETKEMKEMRQTHDTTPNPGNHLDQAASPISRGGAVRRAALAAAGLLAVAAIAVAAPPRGSARFGDGASGEGFPRHAERRVERLAEFLELSDSQLTSWESLRSQHRDAVQPLLEQMRTHRESLRSLMESDSPDATALGEEMLAGRELREDLETGQQDLESGFRALLTAEQLERYEAFREARGDRREQRGRSGPRGRRGRGPGAGVGA